MPSELKSETARINGAKSHGPKTPEGKEASSRNSLKHGFTACHTFILKSENPEEYQKFLAEHLAIHQPATPSEKELIEQMSIARWRIRRFVAAETDLFDCEMVRNREKVDKEFAPTHAGVHFAMALRSLADESRTLSLMSRYESRLQRVHDKAYAALRELQQARPSQPADLEPPPAPSSAPPGPEPPPAPSSAPPGPEPPPAPSAVPSGPAPTADNPTVSAGAFCADKISRNEPTAPPASSPGIHLCTPVPPAENPEDHES